MNEQEKRDNDDNHDEQRPGFFQVLHSVLAAIFGVQSSGNRERDFKKGSAGDYIGVYVVIVLAIVIGMFVVVNMVLSATGS
ncbi:MAG TPA: DUF2970 domain-containing protein [Alcanivorax sp.]|nr:DUF2970 domain-containing protein [Alcanivorax sp.]